jgi:hypothetical protein
MGRKIVRTIGFWHTATRPFATVTAPTPTADIFLNLEYSLRNAPSVESHRGTRLRSRMRRPSMIRRMSIASPSRPIP